MPISELISASFDRSRGPLVVGDRVAVEKPQDHPFYKRAEENAEESAHECVPCDWQGQCLDEQVPRGCICGFHLLVDGGGKDDHDACPNQASNHAEDVQERSVELRRPGDVGEGSLEGILPNHALAEDLKAGPLRPLQSLDDGEDLAKLLLPKFGDHSQLSSLPGHVVDLEGDIVHGPVPVVDLVCKLVPAHKLSDAGEMSRGQPTFIVGLLLACHLPLQTDPLGITLVGAPLYRLRSIWICFPGSHLRILRPRRHGQEIVCIDLIKCQPQGRLVRGMAHLIVVILTIFLLCGAWQRKHPPAPARPGGPRGDGRHLLQALLEGCCILCWPFPLSPTIKQTQVVHLALPRVPLLPVRWQFRHFPLRDVGPQVDIELVPFWRCLKLPTGG
mmetsp:Transcript_1918/g.4644  ORF Transcript_1918/g.4644 Transcript_1918/m.4644 type:complete len:388 (-) Transcript_1918:69-1232(-)